MALGIRSTMALIVLVTLLPLLGLILVEALEERRLAGERAQEEMLSRVSIAVIEEERTIERTERLLASLAAEPGIMDERCDELVARARSQLPYYATVGLADAEGRVVCNAAGGAGANVSIADRLYFRRAMETGRFAIGEYQVGRTTGVPTINFGLPLESDGARIGVVFAALDIRTLQAEELVARLPEGTRHILLDGDARVLYRYPDPEGLTGQQDPPGDIIRTVLRDVQGTARTTGLDGVARFYGFVPIQTNLETPLYMALGVPAAAVLGDVDAQLWQSVATAFFVGVVAIAATTYVVERAVVRPTRRLDEAASRLREGDLSARASPVHGAREFENLGTSFDAMAANLESAAASQAAHGEELRRSEERYRILIEGAREYAIIMLDPGGHIQTWNAGAERLKGYRAEEAIGKHFSLFFTEEDRAAGLPRAILADALERGSHEEVGERVRKDGTRFYANSIVTALRADDGRPLGFAKITRDITELRRAQAAEAAREAAEATTRAKSEFVANMSHEIRTPLNAVIGMSTLLLDTPLTEEQREMALIARTSGEHLLTLINDVLDFSKIEAGKMELEREDLVVADVVEQALDVVTVAANAKGLELAADVADAVPHAVVADPSRLRQVLVNLLSNAIKFTGQGEVTVSVDARREGEEWELVFCVADTGIGIAPEALDRLFQAFTQADASTNRTYGGTGLGLAISRRLVEAMGGRIWAESAPGADSRFSFTIRAPTAGTAPETPPRPHLTGRPVLIVDDNATNRRILAHQLQKWGMRPTAFCSPVEALDRVREGERFDAAVLDYHMPEMNGAALAAELHRVAPSLPLILLSSLGSWRQESEERGVRFSSVLTKPAKASLLFDALSTAIGHAAAPTAQAAPAGSTEALRILLVEDNLVNQRVAALMLKALGMGADVVANGADAVARASEGAYDVVLMDIQMPVMDGLEATRRIRESLPPERQPRIIALTAHALDTERARAFAAGVDDYITKPLDRGALAAALSRAAAARGARR